MRILICTTMYPPDLNGQSVFCRNLAEGMASRGHQVLVLTPACRVGQVQPLAGVRVIHLPVLQLGLVHDDLRLTTRHAGRIRRIFDQFRPDLVHVQDPAPFCQAALREAHRRGIPALAAHHPGPEISAPYFVNWPRPLKTVIERIAWRFVMAHLNHADLVTTPSQNSVRMLAEKGLRRPVTPISCGIRLDDFHPQKRIDRGAVRRKYGLSQNSVVLLYVGRLDGEKRVDLLIRAMAYLPEEEVQLVIAGSGSLEHALQRLTRRLSLEDRVHFLGKVERAALPELINSADLFAMPGNGESFSIATLEAMACARPVLAANAAALPELVSDGENGCLFTPGDPQAAAQAIVRLLALRQEWGRLGEASARRAQAHQLDRVLDRYERLYKDLRAAPFTRPVQPVLRRRVVFQPLFALLVLAVMLFSLIYNTGATQAAPFISLEDLAPKAMEEIRDLITVIPEERGAESLDGGRIQIDLETGERTRLVIRYPQDDLEPDRRMPSDSGVPSARDAVQSIYSALVDLGLPEKFIDFLEPAFSSDEPTRLDDWEWEDIRPR